MCWGSCRTPNERPRPRSAAPMGCGCSRRWNAGCSTGRRPRSVGYDPRERLDPVPRRARQHMDSDQRDRRDPHDEDAPTSAADSSAEVEDSAGEAPTEPVEPVERSEPSEPVQPEPVSAQAPPPSTDEPTAEVDE